MQTRSHWSETAARPTHPPLSEDITVDVAVVGAGITGITTAWLFHKAGLSVALLDRHRCGGWDTSLTTAHLTCVTDASLAELCRRFGPDRARLAWDAGRAAIRRIAHHIESEGIECGFTRVNGYYHTPVDSHPDEEVHELRREADLAVKLGFPARYLDSVPLMNRPGVEFPDQAKFHPLKYLAGLLERMSGPRCHVFENTEVTRIENDPAVVHARAHRVRSGHVVLATHAPFTSQGNLVSATLLQTKLFPYTTYAIGARIPSGAAPEACFWDTADPYAYLRVERGDTGDYAIYGGGDHKTGHETDTLARYRELEQNLAKFLPAAEVRDHWSGQVLETADGLPYIGELSNGHFIATGFAGNGTTFGTLGAMMAVDAVLGRPNGWRGLFDPHRKPIRHGAAMEFLRENTDYPWHIIRDRFAHHRQVDIARLAPGEGAIVDIDGCMTAVYRDKDGSLTACSPVCTHMGCHVEWNNAEKTWDCPCHGSRFSPATGEVLSGPAGRPLQRLSSTVPSLRPGTRAAASVPTQESGVDDARAFETRR